jgi:hypothetical protein
MWPRLRFLTGIILTAISFSSNSFLAHATNEETYFVITAYYSPLPDQSRYTTWSYAWDIRLNGEWHTTASGEWVFAWLLAGPANYPFGTKLYFEWYWIGSIEDRGWAIVKAWERWHSYDRIDIWMGYGDEGLARALTWGTRTVKWKIVVPSAQVSLSFGESPIWSLINLDVNPEDNNYDDVLALQKIFTKAELYNWDLDGIYKSIESELIDYQLKAWVIKSRDDEAAWWYGPKTIAALREEYGNNTSTLIQEPIEDFALYNHKGASEKYKIILEYGDLQVWPDSDSDTIKELQNLFTELGEYNWKIDGKYSSIEDNLINLQIKIGLVNDKDDWGAWHFGNQTKTALWSYYEGENDKSVVSYSYSLSSSEKDILDNGIGKLKNLYSQEIISALKSQINTIIYLDTYKSHKNKLLYLQETL